MDKERVTIVDFFLTFDRYTFDFYSISHLSEAKPIVMIQVKTLPQKMTVETEALADSYYFLINSNKLWRKLKWRSFAKDAEAN